MTDMPVAYRPAKCCRFCRSQGIRLAKRFLRASLETPWCSIRGADVELTYHCSRFRYAAGCRPEKPVAAAAELAERRSEEDPHG